MESILFYVYVFARKRKIFFWSLHITFFFKKRVAVTNFHNGKKKAKYAPATWSTFRALKTRITKNQLYKDFLPFSLSLNMIRCYVSLILFLKSATIINDTMLWSLLLSTSQKKTKQKQTWTIKISLIHGMTLSSGFKIG